MLILTTAERISAAEAIIGYVFHNDQLLVKALEAAGATPAAQGNKRLALIGDAALRLILYELGYEDERSIGDMTSAQNTRATNENLARIGFSLGLNAYIHLNPSAQGIVPGRLMATTVEAIIGAVYLDSNKDVMTIRRLILHLCITQAE
ncbi:hypothetical protein N7456_013657 [Penicillium angulare]|uniref:RNase III domain-containing protein n=1 Tax=Penicillium angulare TaxID=116970 RepID=A0A9W9EFS8_9EURO|nr:hypothetical protein N7456_013657 [Penicillium angulare]